MKKSMFLFVIALSALAMFSCKKEKLNDYEKCFQIPSSKSISSGELLGDTVFIEWRVNDGANGKFTSIISQSKLSSNGVPELVINGTFVSEPVNKDFFVLADPMGTANSLHFSGRIPPGIRNENIISGRKIQSHATGLERNQKNLLFGVLLKFVNHLLPVYRFSGKHTVIPLSSAIRIA